MGGGHAGVEFLFSLMVNKVWVNGGAVAFTSCFTSAACASVVSAVSACATRAHRCVVLRLPLSANVVLQVFAADKAQYYEVLVEYKGTKTSGAPMAAAAAAWGTSNIYARLVPPSSFYSVDMRGFM